ncbi:MAG: dipeptidase [Desulfomicrobium escambiense]|nr:dipeptidase [Desulfomicrobium escambiense]
MDGQQRPALGARVTRPGTTSTGSTSRPAARRCRPTCPAAARRGRACSGRCACRRTLAGQQAVTATARADRHRPPHDAREYPDDLELAPHRRRRAAGFPRAGRIASLIGMEGGHSHRLLARGAADVRTRWARAT